MGEIIQLDEYRKDSNVVDFFAVLDQWSDDIPVTEIVKKIHQSSIKSVLLKNQDGPQSRIYKNAYLLFQGVFWELFARQLENFYCWKDEAWCIFLWKQYCIVWLDTSEDRIKKAINSIFKYFTTSQNSQQNIFNLCIITLSNSEKTVTLTFRNSKKIQLSF